MIHDAAEYVLRSLDSNDKEEESKSEEPSVSTQSFLAGSDQLTVVCGSWNVGNKPPPKSTELSHWFHDLEAEIYVIGAQVSLYDISFLNLCGVSVPFVFNVGSQVQHFEIKRIISYVCIL